MGDIDKVHILNSVFLKHHFETIEPTKVSVAYNDCRMSRT